MTGVSSVLGSIPGSVLFPGATSLGSAVRQLRRVYRQRACRRIIGRSKTDGFEVNVAIVRPSEIGRTAPREITVTWEDGHVSVFPASYLREVCGCAGCVDEWTGETRIAPGSIPQATDVVDAEHVGAYAVRFIFTDGHSDGLYSYQRLRQFCPCDACRAANPRPRY